MQALASRPGARRPMLSAGLSLAHVIPKAGAELEAMVTLFRCDDFHPT